MDLQYLLTNYKPAYPPSGLWEETLAGMLADPHEKAIVDQLCSVLLAGKKFREPVVIGLVEEDVEENEPAFYTVFNGTHRVVAHMLTQTSEVYVEHFDERDFNSEEVDSWVMTTVKFGSSLSAELSDDIFGALRSFPLDEHIWVESDMLMMLENSLEIIWTFSPSQVQLFELVTLMIETRLKNLGVSNFEVETAVDSM